MEPSSIRRLHLRRADVCGACARTLAVGEVAGWDKSSRTVTCVACLDATVPSSGSDLQVLKSDAGASLQREYDRRMAAREQRVRARFPRVGRLLLAVVPEAQTTRAFAQGAEGERRVAKMLEEGCPDCLFLHNRQRGSGAKTGDIDHLVVAPSGVYVIDAKHYEGASVDVVRVGGLLSQRREILKVRGRDKTSLVESLEKQKSVVEHVVDDLGDVPVFTSFCFVGADLPLLRSLHVNGHPVRGLRATRKALQAPGPLDAARRQEIWELLGRRLLPAR